MRLQISTSSQFLTFEMTKTEFETLIVIKNLFWNYIMRSKNKDSSQDLLTSISNFMIWNHINSSITLNYQLLWVHLMLLRMETILRLEWAMDRFYFDLKSLLENTQKRKWWMMKIGCFKHFQRIRDLKRAKTINISIEVNMSIQLKKCKFLKSNES